MNGLFKSRKRLRTTDFFLLQKHSESQSWKSPWSCLHGALPDIYKQNLIFCRPLLGFNLFGAQFRGQSNLISFFHIVSLPEESSSKHIWHKIKRFGIKQWGHPHWSSVLEAPRNGGPSVLVMMQNQNLRCKNIVLLKAKYALPASVLVTEWFAGAEIHETITGRSQVSKPTFAFFVS